MSGPSSAAAHDSLRSLIGGDLRSPEWPVLQPARKEAPSGMFAVWARNAAREKGRSGCLAGSRKKAEATG